MQTHSTNKLPLVIFPSFSPLFSALSPFLSIYLSLSFLSLSSSFLPLLSVLPLVHLHFHSVSLLTLLFLLSYSPTTTTPLFAPPHPPLHLLQFAALVFHFYCFAVQLILFDSKARSKREEKRYCLWIFSDILNRLRLFPSLSLSPSLSLCFYFVVVVAFFRLLIGDRESGASPGHKLLMAALPHLPLSLLSLSPCSPCSSLDSNKSNKLTTQEMKHDIALSLSLCQRRSQRWQRQRIVAYTFFND